jgi:hypothetical protein
MTSPAQSVHEPSAALQNAAAAEAARYALLRRLAPSMRHHLVVNLQPIGMVYEIMDRRLRAPEPNLAEIQDGANKINGYARAALGSCLDVVTWLAPEEDARTTASEGVRECLGLVATSFTFRGYALRNEVDAVPGEVKRASFRTVLTAALIHLTDENPPPAEILLGAQSTSDALVITLALRSTDGEQGFSTAPAYRPLTWSDLQALARDECVGLQRDASGLRLSLLWAGAPD